MRNADPFRPRIECGVLASVMHDQPCTHEAYELRAFESNFARVVAGWVTTANELFTLAPATPPPLTAEKVRAWTKQRDNPLLFWQVGGKIPIGYAELNFTSRDRREVWIGHLIVPQAHRGRGIGYALMQHLLERAFGDMSARSLSLVVFPENDVAINCYLKCGLARDGIHIRSFEHRPGEFKMLKMKMTRRLFQRLQIRSRSPR